MTYQRGSEAEADELPGGFATFGAATNDFMDHLKAAMVLKPHCESPIEVMLGAAVMIRSALMLCTQYDEPLFITWPLLIPQYKFSRYRADFAVRPFGTAYLFLECDGAEFHSTDEQRERDREKDATAARAGIPVLRFTGKEINRDAKACAEVVMSRIVRMCR